MARGELPSARARRRAAARKHETRAEAKHTHTHTHTGNGAARSAAQPMCTVAFGAETFTATVTATNVP